MDTQTRQQLIDAYKDGYRLVAEALAGATRERQEALTRANAELAELNRRRLSSQPFAPYNPPTSGPPQP